MKRTVLLAVLAAAFTAACWPTRPNPRYCKVKDDCVLPGLTECDTSRNECVAPDDASVGPDIPAPPDLTPMCSADLGCAMADKPICDDTSHTCRACQTGECGGALHCNTTSGACVECLVEADCASIRGVCSASNTCIACKANSECQSGLCDDGKCAAEGDVAYVDNGQAPCTGADGSRTKPYCEINPAVATGKPYVSVAGSSSAYQTVSFTGNGTTTVTIIGPGKGATTKALINQSGLVAVNVAPSGGSTSVTLHGLELIGANAPMPKAAVACSGAGGTAHLTIRDSYVHASGGVGVDANTCDTTLARNLITMNSGGGVKIAGGMFTVENNFIVLNSSTALPGLSMDAASTGTTHFNTIAGNMLAGGRGGVDCGAAGNKEIKDSIVFGNSATMGTQFGAQCTVSNVVTGTDSIGGASQVTPTFVSSSDFHLAGGGANIGCCVNKAGLGPALDVDGEKRPKGIGFDIGADEAE